MLAIVIPLALVAAFLYACSDFLEQRAAQRGAQQSGDDGDGPSGVRDRLLAGVRTAVGTLKRLVRDKLWFAGWAAGTLAYLVQAVGLYLGSVSVVQALQVTTLLFTLPLSTYGTNRRVGLREWSGGALVTGGLILFLVARGQQPGADQAHRGRLIFILVILAIAVVVLAAFAALQSGPVAAVALAVAAGASFASSATLVKLTSTDLTERGILATATDWPGYSLAVVSVVGVVLQQLAFASGKLPVAATAMTVANPFVGTVVAIIAFDEKLPGDPVRLGGIGLGAALVFAGVYLLQHSPLLRDPSPDPVPQFGHGSPATA